MSYKCLPLDPSIKPYKGRSEVAPDVYEPGDLEHPSIPGLLLTLEERLYGGHLELVADDGSGQRTETPEEKRFRLLWRTPIPATPTRTSGNFVTMDMSLFKQN